MLLVRQLLFEVEFVQRGNVEVRWSSALLCGSVLQIGFTLICCQCWMILQWEDCQVQASTSQWIRTASNWQIGKLFSGIDEWLCDLWSCL